MATEPPENQPMEIVRIKNKDPEDGFKDIIYVNQNLETILQKMTHQIAALTVAFIFWGIIFFHAIVQATVVPLRKKWWIPFSMFTLISAVYFYTLEIILRDYNRVRHEYGLTLDLVHKGSTTSAENKTSRTKKNWFDSLLDLYRKNLYIIVLRSVMLAFCFLIMFACRSILRDQSP